MTYEYSQFIEKIKQRSQDIFNYTYAEDEEVSSYFFYSGNFNVEHMQRTMRVFGPHAYGLEHIGNYLYGLTIRVVRVRNFINVEKVT